MKRISFSLALAWLSPLALAAEMSVGVANLQDYIDPGRDHSNVGSQLYINSFETLIAQDPRAAEPSFMPALAVSWERISPTAMDFKLREGVTFHNGEAMTADDVVFSLSRMFNPTYPPYVTRQREYFLNMYKAEKLDDYTVRVHTKRPDPIFETLMAVQQAMIVPKDYISGLSGHPEVDEVSDYEAFGLAPVGTGPYKITNWVPGEGFVWERHEDYWGEPAPMERVVVDRIPELAARITGLASGELDLITNLPPDQVQTVEGNADTKVVGALTPLFHVVFFNTNHPLMTKPLRQAMVAGIDRQLLVDALWNGKAKVPANHSYPQYGPLYMPEYQVLEYDPDKARRLVEESGYDGFEIRYDTHPTYYTNGLLAAQALKEMWADIGIDLVLNVDERWTGNDNDCSVMDDCLMVRNWSNPMYFPDPVGSFGTMWSPGGARINAGSWTPEDPAAYQALYERFRFSEDVETRKALYREIMDQVMKEEAAFTILYQPYESYGLRNNVEWQPLPGHIPYVLDFRAGNLSVGEES